VYGHSAGASDAHIYDALFTANIDHLYFCVYEPSGDLAEIDSRLSAHQKHLASNVGYTLVDSESAGVWGAARKLADRANSARGLGHRVLATLHARYCPSLPPRYWPRSCRIDISRFRPWGVPSQAAVATSVNLDRAASAKSVPSDGAMAFFA
jgi:hypothetical protein